MGRCTFMWISNGRICRCVHWEGHRDRHQDDLAWVRVGCEDDVEIPNIPVMIAEHEREIRKLRELSGRG